MSNNKKTCSNCAHCINCAEGLNCINVAKWTVALFGPHVVAPNDTCFRHALRKVRSDNSR